MSLKVILVVCLQLVVCWEQVWGQVWDVQSSSPGVVKETVYDINLYISIPASVIALGLLLCICYCLLGSCRDPDQRSNNAFQPVIVTNRNSPLMVSAQSSSHIEDGTETVSGSVTHQQNTNSTQSRAQNQMPGRICSRKSVPSANQKSGGQLTTQTNPAKAADHQVPRSDVTSEHKSVSGTTTQPISASTSSPDSQTPASPVRPQKSSKTPLTPVPNEGMDSPSISPPKASPLL